MHHAELVRLALFIVRDLPTAEDVVQDVFARIQARPDNRPNPGRELAYLRASVLNGCRSVHRRRAVATRLGLEPGTDPAHRFRCRPAGPASVQLRLILQRWQAGAGHIGRRLLVTGS
jgi:DNA-directed RNA polymerase specialized sigma24 family protein